MKIYNSLTNSKEDFRPLEPNKIKMYVCGPTVYNYIHIGNARPVIFFDVVRRFFLYRGYDVTFVSNITDVDDKIINTAIENNVTELEVANQYTQAFLNNVNQLNCLPFDINPKVTQYMDKIIDFIKQLEEKGYAYEVDGDVYFRVNRIEDYGQLSNQETEHLEIGARITEHHKKENPLDFTLWKKTKIGIQWDSPWGLGRPGWHTECVAMINDTLGKEIDIHGGGSDLKFPHHENEIAQSKAITGTNLAQYWLHNGRLMIDNEKMSKSLGNFIRLNDFLMNYDYRVLRLFMLSTQYRQPLNFTDEMIEATKAEIEKIESSLKQLQFKLDLNDYLEQIIEVEDAFVNEVRNEFIVAMEDDFNTANAITTLMKITKEVNKSVRKASYTEEELNHLLSVYHLFKEILSVLGIDFNIIRLSDEMKNWIKCRDEARKIKDFTTADHYRSLLMEKGINI
jgi:cysteinyl-tRNA synthetase